MRHLTLIRHAKSSWKSPHLPDFERPLNKRGQRDAPEMGRRLARRRHPVALILSSPALRARRTAEIIAKAVDYPADTIRYDQRIYEAMPQELLAVLREVDDRHADIMLFGHNPGLTDLVNLLCASEIENMPTCGVARIECAIDHWSRIVPGCGTLLEFDVPKNRAD